MELYGSLFNISGSVTASAFTGSFVGNGGGLYNLPASGVTGLNLSQIASGDATASITASGFTVNKNTQIQGNLSVSGALTANEYIVSSSVIYMTTSFASGSSAFGDDLMDTHKFTGSVQITGSISLNGQAIGTGKLDETTFQSYTSSNNSRVTALETSSGSLNSFTSSINTTIKSKLDADSVISGSAQVVLTGTTGYDTFSSSIATTTSGLTSTATSLSSSLTSSIGSLSSSIATTDLNQENRLNALETSSGSLNSFTSSINTTIKSKLDTESVISGSAQVNITGTTGYSTFSSSISNSINNLSGSVATTTSGITSTITSLSSSLTSSVGELSSSVATTTLNLKNRVDSIETSTGSLNSFTGSINTTIKSKLDTENVISGSVQVNITGTTGYSTFSSSISTSIGSLSSSVATTTNDLSSSLTSSIGSLSSSVATTTSGLTSTITSLSSSIATTTSGLTSTITSLSSSVSITTSGLTSTISSLSSSIATTTLNQSGRLTSIEGKTGSYATTGSNTYQGDQTITGSLYISQNLIVAGSSSIQHISSSVVNIADNIITVNAQNPSVRFGGLAVIDSGSSPQVSGSLLFDATENEWIFVHQNQTAVTSALLIMGPETYNDIGNEIHLTNNRLVKSTTDEHIGDSNITDTGTKVSVNSNTEITGSLIVAGGNKLTVNAAGGDEGGEILLSKAITNTTLAGEGVTIDVWQNRLRFFEQGGNARGAYIDISSLANGVGTNLLGTAATASYVEYSNVANKPTLVSGSSQISFLSVSNIPSGLVSGSSQVLAGTTIHSGAFFNGISVVSGSAQISFGGITGVPAGLVSGSSQITFGSISSIPSGLVSGSSQISIASTTGFGTYLNQALLTTSTPTFSTVSATTFTGALSGNASTATTSTYANYLNALSNYVWASSTLPTSYHQGITAAFVGPNVGEGSWQNYGSVMTMRTYSGGGGSLQMYVPYGPSNGGDSLQVRFGNYNVSSGNSWTSWKTLIDSGNIGSQTVATAGALSSMNISQFTNNSGYITGINSSAVTTALGYTPYNATNPNGYITGISFANVSSKPTTISGYGITDAITTGNISSQTVSNSSQLQGLNKAQLWNNSGQNHSTYQTFGAIPNFGVWFMQNSSAADTPQSASQYYVQTVGLGNDYAYGTYGLMTAVARDHSLKYTYYRTQENGTWGSWTKSAAGYADTAGSLSSMNISQFTNNSGYITGVTNISGTAASETLSTVTSRGNSTAQNIVFSNGRKGLVGVYDAAQTQAIFAMGPAYVLTDGGGSATYGDIYGLAWSYNPGYGGAGNNPQSKSGLEHQLLVMNAGVTRTAIGVGIWTSGGVTCGTVLPLSNNSYNLGSTGTRWANIYTNDLHLSNEGKEGGNEIDGTTGDWTIQEGEENLYIINHKNGKKFKIDLTEIV
jgi:hypothetical protein